MGIHKLLLSAAGNQESFTIPPYYTSQSGYMIYQPGGSATTLQLKDSLNISTGTDIKNYTGLTDLSQSNYIQDKDLDSNVYYGVINVSVANKSIVKAVLDGSTSPGTATMTTLLNNQSYGGTCYGSCYAPKILWNTTKNNGAFIFTTFSANYIYVFPFSSSSKTGFSLPYSIFDNDGPSGIDVVPKAVSGFTNDYAVTISGVDNLLNRIYRFTSYVIDMAQGSNVGWTNQTRSPTYTPYTGGPPSPGVSYGPQYQGPVLYYPPGKPVARDDTNQINTNRIVCIDTQSSLFFVWKLTEATNSLTFTFLYGSSTLDTFGIPNGLSLTSAQAIDPSLPPLPPLPLASYTLTTPLSAETTFDMTSYPAISSATSLTYYVIGGGANGGTPASSTIGQNNFGGGGGGAGTLATGTIPIDPNTGLLQYFVGNGSETIYPDPLNPGFFEGDPGTNGQNSYIKYNSVTIATGGGGLRTTIISPITFNRFGTFQNNGGAGGSGDATGNGANGDAPGGTNGGTGGQGGPGYSITDMMRVLGSGGTGGAGAPFSGSGGGSGANGTTYGAGGGGGGGLSANVSVEGQIAGAGGAGAAGAIKLVFYA
jgi:hypothetical protein